jgi:rhodanese-related sulfurtransferase
MRSLLGRIARRLLKPTPPVSTPAPPPRTADPPSPVADELPLEVEEPVPGSLLLDCREPGEYASGVAVGALLLPMDLVPHHLGDLPRDRSITVYCAAGARSAGVAHWLREQGFAQAVSLSGGVGVLRFSGIEVAVPAGVPPGTRLVLPADTLVDGVRLGAPADAEVLEEVGATLRVRFFDASGYQVLAVIPAP